MTQREVFERAADIIEERGWTQGDYIDDDGCVCMVGAIRLACGGVEIVVADCLHTIQVPRGPDFGFYESIVDDCNRYGIAHAATWNDDPARTKEEVVAKLREIAAGLP